MKLKNFHKILKATPDEVHNEVKFSMDVLDRINYLLDKHFDGKQKHLAEKMGKSEAEVSKWFSGMQNFTVRTIIKLEAAFGDPILAVCSNDDDNSTFEQVAIHVCGNKLSLEVDGDGAIENVEMEYSAFHPTLELAENPGGA